MTVVPIAKDKYDRREEQIFREYVRRNVDQANNTANMAIETFRFVNLPVYADDTAAGVGGLTQGKFYRTATGVVMVKL